MIEMIVAIGLFAIVTALGVGGFTSALRTERQSSALLAANSNVSLAIEQMMREIRTGSHFCTVQICGSSDLKFKNSRGEDVTYCFTQNAIERGVGAGGCGSNNFQKITADNVRVEYLEFYRTGTAPPPDQYQPRIVIAIGISAPEQGVSGNIINMQTTVSPRMPLDI